jgi:hypothetical protein
MAITVIATTAAGSTDSGMSVTTSPLDTTGATGIILVVSSYGVGAPGYTIADNKSNGAPIDPSLFHTTGSASVRLWYYLAPTVGANHTFTVTCSPSAEYPWIAVLAVSGLKLTTPLDQSAQNGAAAASVQPGSVTPTEANELLVTGLGFYNVSLPAIDSSFTLSQSATGGSGQYFPGGMAYKIQTTAGAENPTWSWTGGSTEAAALIATFKAEPTTTTLTAIPPDAVLASTNLSVALADIDEDPDSPDANWATATTPTAATDLRVSFGTPAANPYSAQNFRVQVRKTAGSGLPPTLSAELRQGNTLRKTCFSGTSITSGSGQVLQADWAASDLVTVLDGSDVELRLVSVPGAVATPGGIPAYNSAGTLFTNATLAATYSVNIPTHTSGDLLLLLVHLRNTNADTTTLTVNTAGWSTASGNMYGGTNTSRLGLAWKLGNGSETSVSITATGGATQDRIQARVYRFTAANGFASPPVANITAGVTGNSANGSMPTVTPSGTNRLAVALIAHADSSTIAAATGETGGDWTEPIAEDAGTNGTIGIQVSNQSGGGSISGGTATFGVFGVWITLGCALVPANVAGAAESTVEIGAVEWNAQYLTPSGPPTPNSASDTTRPVLGEATSLRRLATVTDPVRPVLTEVSSLIGRSALTDPTRPVLTEARTLASRTTTTETARPVVTEARTLVGRSALSDTTRPIVTEAPATLLSAEAKLAAETVRPVVTEASTLISRTSTPETERPILSEAVSLVGRTSASEPLTPRLGEVRTLIARAALAETLRPITPEQAALVGRSLRPESLTPVLSEAAVVRWPLNAADTTRPVLGESATVVAAGTITQAATETLTPRLTEAVAITRPLGASDTARPVLGESASVQIAGVLSKAAVESLSPRLGEVASLVTLQLKAATDTLGPRVSPETAAIQIGGVVAQAAADTVHPALGEQATRLSFQALAAVEGLTPTLGEQASVAILATVTAGDRVVICLGEAPAQVLITVPNAPVGSLRLAQVRLAPAGRVPQPLVKPAAVAAGVEIADATLSDPRTV